MLEGLFIFSILIKEMSRGFWVKCLVAQVGNNSSYLWVFKSDLIVIIWPYYLILLSFDLIIVWPFDYLTISSLNLSINWPYYCMTLPSYYYLTLNLLPHVNGSFVIHDWNVSKLMNSEYILLMNIHNAVICLYSFVKHFTFTFNL